LVEKGRRRRRVVAGRFRELPVFVANPLKLSEFPTF
jgi:hypothetical protein